jgi:hypothetical protein
MSKLYVINCMLLRYVKFSKNETFFDLFLIKMDVFVSKSLVF